MLWFLGGILTHAAKTMGYDFPSFFRFLYYDWADANTVLVATLFASLFAVVIPLFALGIKLSEAKADVVLEHDPRPPILLLRSFTGEQRAAIAEDSFGRVTALENRLQLAVAGVGPFIAVGRPGEKIAYRGAARAYYSGDAWRGAVLEFMKQASAVILVAGQSEGLLWEMEQLVSHGHLGKTVIVLPPEEDARARTARWATLLRAFPSLSRTPVTAPDSIVAVSFTSNANVLFWSSRRLRAADYYDVLRLALYDRERCADQ